jgi:hypothetical protein
LKEKLDLIHKWIRRKGPTSRKPRDMGHSALCSAG